MALTFTKGLILTKWGRRKIFKIKESEREKLHLILKGVIVPQSRPTLTVHSVCREKPDLLPSRKEADMCCPHGSLSAGHVLTSALGSGAWRRLRLPGLNGVAGLKQAKYLSGEESTI